MENQRCFVRGCIAFVEYACPCSSPATYICKLHISKHMKLRGKNHMLSSAFIEPREDAREAILKFLANIDSKHKKLKLKVLASFYQRSLEAKKDLEEMITKINSYSDELGNCFEKISQAQKISNSEQDPILRLLSLQPDEAVEKVKNIFSPNSDWYNDMKIFFEPNEKNKKMIDHFTQDENEGSEDSRLESTHKKHRKSINLINNEPANVNDSISNLINENKKSLKQFEDIKEAINMKTKDEVSLLRAETPSVAEDLSRLKEVEETPNKADSEQEPKMTGKVFKNDSWSQSSPLMQAYQGSAMTHREQISLYSLLSKNYEATTLLIYNTEIEAKEEKIIQTPELDCYSCITQLPSGKLFCYGNKWYSGIALIIDENGGVLELPPGTPSRWSSAIYFNNNVYCFGGSDDNLLNRPNRFDLDRNEWVELTPLPRANSSCNSIIFNGDILVSGFKDRNLVRYSIGGNSFTTIPYRFAEFKRKIMIYRDRLYLIECPNGSIYESEIESDTVWRRIGNSAITFLPSQTYCSYNKGEVYIGCNYFDKSNYFRFNFANKSLMKLP